MSYHSAVLLCLMTVLLTATRQVSGQLSWVPSPSEPPAITDTSGWKQTHHPHPPAAEDLGHLDVGETSRWQDGEITETSSAGWKGMFHPSAAQDMKLDNTETSEWSRERFHPSAAEDLNFGNAETSKRRREKIHPGAAVDLLFDNTEPSVWRRARFHPSNVENLNLEHPEGKYQHSTAEGNYGDEREEEEEERVFTHSYLGRDQQQKQLHWFRYTVTQGDSQPTLTLPQRREAIGGVSLEGKDHKRRNTHNIGERDTTELTENRTEASSPSHILKRGEGKEEELQESRELGEDEEEEGQKEEAATNVYYPPKPILSAEDLERAGQPLCRNGHTYLPPDLFEADSCANCYYYLVPLNRDLFASVWRRVPTVRTVETEDGRRTSYTVHLLLNPVDNRTYLASVSSEILRSSFRSEVGAAKWERCCQASSSCCREMRHKPWPQGYCPNTWDGWQCWNATPPGTQARMPCPSYAYYGKVPSCTKEATKQCEAEGWWYRKMGREWSDYRSCGVQENIKLRLYVHIAAYSVSVAALLPALCIFFSYKQLRAHRFTLHKNLFLSLLLEATGSIALRSLQLSHNSTIQKSPGWCVALTLLTRYTSLSNYMWYLSEGFYLHKLLASAFAEQRSLITFYIIGWGFPLVAVGVYSVARALTHPNTHCWILPSGPLEWIINIPPLLAILINIVFLVNIIRILVSKVRATSGTEPSQYRKAVRATMMVVPLFGLQYVVTIYRHQALGCDWHDLYQIFNNVIEGSTGTVVAIIFCYTNGEVRTLVRRWWSLVLERRSTRGCEAIRSRSLSTVHTTLLPARRNSSLVSITTNNHHIIRGTNSGANTGGHILLHSLPGSRCSTTTQQPNTASADTTNNASARRSPHLMEAKTSPGECCEELAVSNNVSQSPNSSAPGVGESEEEGVAVVTGDGRTRSPVLAITTQKPQEEKLLSGNSLVLFKKGITCEPSVEVKVAVQRQSNGTQ